MKLVFLGEILGPLRKHHIKIRKEGTKRKEGGGGVLKEQHHCFTSFQYHLRSIQIFDHVGFYCIEFKGLEIVATLNFSIQQFKVTDFGLMLNSFHP